MEPSTGAPLRAHGLRPLNLPRPVVVELDARGLPALVTLSGAGTRHVPGGQGAPEQRTNPSRETSRAPHHTPHAVERVQEVWRVAEAWWRGAPVRRTYWQLVIDGGRTLTLFHDDAEDAGSGWFEQRY